MKGCQRASPSRRLPRRSRNLPGKFSVVRGLTKFLLFWYILAMILSETVILSRIGSPANVSLSSKDLPRKLSLKIRSRKRQSGINCLSEADPYFVRYGGDQCETIVYESRVLSSGKPRSDDDQVARVKLRYQNFMSDVAAHEYYWRFWGLHASEILPATYYLNVQDRISPIGDEYRALYYNPDLVMPYSNDEEYKAEHMQIITRMGPTVLHLTISGFPHVDTKAINPQLAKTITDVIQERIQYPSTTGAAIRKTAVRVLKFGKELDHWLLQLWLSYQSPPLSGGFDWITSWEPILYFRRKWTTDSTVLTVSPPAVTVGDTRNNMVTPSENGSRWITIADDATILPPLSESTMDLRRISSLNSSQGADDSFAHIVTMPMNGGSMEDNSTYDITSVDVKWNSINAPIKSMDLSASNYEAREMKTDWRPSLLYFGTNSDDVTLTSDSLDYLGANDVSDEEGSRKCTVSWSSSQLMLHRIACTIYISCQAVHMAVSVAIPLGLLAAGEVIHTFGVSHTKRRRVLHIHAIP